MSIFNLVSGQIGIKKLTEPDLGTPTSHQTHIGLYEGTLSHLPYERKEYISQLIYNQNSYEGLLFLKFINNNRSPAINLGSRAEQRNLPENVVSIGKQIREFADTNRNLNWFLIWFALDNNEIITILLNDNSTEYRELQDIGINLSQHHNRGLTIGEDDDNYNQLKSFLTNLVENVNAGYLEDLEIASQTGETQSTRRVLPRPRDIEEANRVFRNTGIRGEELLNEYLQLQKDNSVINDFKWLNQSREQGMPYDFEIIKADNSKWYSDAKTTGFDFSQPMVLSKGELNFIDANKENYLVHRIYSINEEPKFRVCTNVFRVSELMMPNLTTFNESLGTNGLSIRNLSLTVPTVSSFLEFENEIILNANA